MKLCKIVSCLKLIGEDNVGLGIGIVMNELNIGKLNVICAVSLLFNIDVHILGKLIAELVEAVLQLKGTVVDLCLIAAFCGINVIHLNVSVLDLLVQGGKLIQNGVHSAVGGDDILSCGKLDLAYSFIEILDDIDDRFCRVHRNGGKILPVCACGGEGLEGSL